MGRQRSLSCLIAVVALASGCGSTSQPKANGEAAKPASQILVDAQRAAANASSVHAVGQGTSGKGQGSLEISINRQVGSYGKFRIEGTAIEVLHRGPRVYLRGDRPFWRRFGNVGLPIARITGRWVVAAASEPRLAGFTRTLSWPGFVSQFYIPGKVVNQGVKTFHGRQAIVLTDAKAKGTLYVSATGKPYPLAIAGGPARVTITFDHWSQPVQIPGRPKGAKPILLAAG